MLLISHAAMSRKTSFPDLTRVTRFEVIDETGRVIVKYGVAIEASLQDDGRTLKVFTRTVTPAPDVDHDWVAGPAVGREMI